MNVLPFIPLMGLILLTGLVGAKILILKKQGVKPGSNQKTSVRKTSKNLLFIPFVLLFLAEVIYPVVPNSVPFLQVAHFSVPFLQIMGGVLVMLSVITMLLTLLHFKKSLRFGLRPHNSGPLVTNGIFALSRNPFFISINLYFIGTAFVFQSILSIAFAIAAVISIHWYILKEERFMHSVYDEEYTRYCQTTRRYF
jgi:protein-S-isoprenylcysteine O-methyltransferase Ste14